MYVVVGRGYEEVLDEIALLEVHPHYPPPAPSLGAVGGDGEPFHVTGVGDGHHHLLLRDEVLYLQVFVVGDDLRPARIGEALLDGLQLLDDDGFEPGLVRQYLLQARYLLLEFLVLVLDLLPLQPGQPLQPHVQDGLGLLLAQLELLHQPFPGVFHRAGLLDQGYDLVQVGQGYEQPLQDVGPLLRPVEVEPRAPGHHLHLVLDVSRQRVLEAQGSRHRPHQGDHYYPEGVLQLGVLVELVQYHLGRAVLAQLHHQPHAGAVALVAQVGHAGQLLFPYQLGDPLRQPRLVHLVGDLGDHDARASRLVLLDVRLAPDPDNPAPRLVGLAQALEAHDHAPGGEVRALHQLHQLLGLDFRLSYHGDCRVYHLAQVVRGYVGGHPHGDARGAVGQQVGVA